MLLNKAVMSEETKWKQLVEIDMKFHSQQQKITKTISKAASKSLLQQHCKVNPVSCTFSFISNTCHLLLGNI